VPRFIAAKPKLSEVEKELRAQIELALKKGLNISHLSSHMYAAVYTPELKAIVKKLAAEYRLHISGYVGEKRGWVSSKYSILSFDMESGEWFPTYGVPPRKKEYFLARILERLTPGLWLIGMHPGLDTPEMRAMIAIDPTERQNVAAHREAETEVLTSKRIKQIIKNRKIKLMSYRDIKK
jgi:predicted glycoside hydrolase/deacetylase ChbG (UPF0249 family)